MEIQQGACRMLRGGTVLKYLTLIVYLVLAAATFGSDRARAAGRVALVLGNSDYETEPKLTNPANDAADFGNALRDIGFRVIVGTNLDKFGMERKLREFIEMSDGADIALLFYAGHGIQVDGQNYLIPTDAQLKRRADLDFELINTGNLISSLELGAKTTLVFLDACRDNPLAANLSPQSDRSVSAVRGLSPQAASEAGILIAFSTAPGRVARDGQDRNSPFTAALLHAVRTPGLEIKTLMTRVRSEVASVTHDEQIPWDTESLRNDVFLVPAALPVEAKPAPAATSTPAHAPETVAETPCDALIDPHASPSDILLKDIDSGIRECAMAASQYPMEHKYVQLLRAGEEQRAYKNAVNSPERELSDAYLVVYPNGKYANAVRSHVALLSTPPEAPSAPPTAPPLTENSELIKSIERELRRVGCYAGAIDGLWGPSIVKGLEAIARKTALALDTDAPSDPLLERLRGTDRIVCGAPDTQAEAQPRIVRPNPPPARAPARVSRKSDPAPRAQGGCFQVGALQYCN